MLFAPTSACASGRKSTGARTSTGTSRTRTGAAVTDGGGRLRDCGPAPLRQAAPTIAQEAARQAIKRRLGVGTDVLNMRFSTWAQWRPPIVCGKASFADRWRIFPLSGTARVPLRAVSLVAASGRRALERTHELGPDAEGGEQPVEARLRLLAARANLLAEDELVLERVLPPG